MNHITVGRKTYKYESFWRDKKNIRTLDSKGKPLPWPAERKKQDYQNIESFIDKLSSVENFLKNNRKFIKYDHPKDCLLCDKKRITHGLLSINHMRWEDGLTHYIEVHNITPSEEFIDFIFRFDESKTRRPIKVTRIRGINVTKSGKKFVKLERNQILIMDALMAHGGYKIYKDENDNNVYRYSEHAGLLDFNYKGLERLIVSGNTSRVDTYDEEIFLPKDILDAFDYEYIFHTHPPTPKPGGRADVGILYEFPSISDIFHFIDHYNNGQTQGSIVVAPEGMYVIRKKEADDKQIRINEDNFYHDANKIFIKCQREALQLYGTKFTTHEFYSKIAQDKSYMTRINKVLNNYEIHIDYFSRIKDEQNNWVIDSVYLPVYIIKPSL